MDTQLWVSDNGRRWASCNGQTWAATSAHLGSPHPSILGNHPCPRWVSNFVHIGNPHLPTLGIQLCPYWKPIYVHVGRPRLSMLGVHSCPQWTAKPTQVGSPTPSMLGNHVCPCWKSTPVTMDVQIHPSWKPNPCEWTTKMPPKLDAQSLCVDARSCRRLEAHPERWTPIIARGHATLPELRMPTSWIVEAHFLRWPRDLNASGCPIRNVADHPDL